MRCNLITAKAVGVGSGNLPPTLLFPLGVYKQNLRKMHPLLRQRVVENHSAPIGGANKLQKRKPLDVLL